MFKKITILVVLSLFNFRKESEALELFLDCTADYQKNYRQDSWEKMESISEYISVYQHKDSMEGYAAETENLCLGDFSDAVRVNQTDIFIYCPPQKPIPDTNISIIIYRTSGDFFILFWTEGVDDPFMFRGVCSPANRRF